MAVYNVLNSFFAQDLPSEYNDSYTNWGFVKYVIEYILKLKALRLTQTM